MIKAPRTGQTVSAAARRRLPRVVKTLRPVHPNAGVGAWYYGELERVVRMAHSELQAVIVANYKPLPIREDAAGLHVMQPVAMDAPIDKLRAAVDKWGKNWTTKLDAAALKLSKGFAAKAFGATEQQMRQALKDAGFTVEFRPTKESIEAFKAVVAENVGLIKSIPQQYLTQVRTHVFQAVQKGSDMAALSAKLQEQYGVTTRRAALISRDQNAKAKATIETTRRIQLGIRQAIWQHSAGGKEPRPQHVKWGREGKVFDVDKGLYDEEAGEWVLPGTLINCRCTSRAIIPGFTDE